MFQNSLRGVAVGYNLPYRNSLLLCYLYCVLQEKNEIIEERLRWSLKVVSPGGSSCLQYFPANAGTCNFSCSTLT